MLMPDEACTRALRFVREAKILSYDTETSGVDWKRNSPIGYVLCADPDNSIYIPIRHGGGGNIPGGKPMQAPDEAIELHPFERELAQAFEDRQRLGLVTVGHNLKFDAHMSMNAGIRLNRQLSDTQNYACLIDEYRKSYSLDACCTDFRVTAKKGDELYEAIRKAVPEAKEGRKSMEFFWRTNGYDPVVQDYAAGDGVSTLELWQVMRQKLQDEDLLQVAGLEDRLVYVLFDIERRGIKLDEGYRDELFEWTNRREEEARSKLPEEFNPRSPVAVRNLCEASGHTEWPTTEKGNPSFTEAFLKTFPEGEAVVALRQVTNLRNSFAGPLYEEHMHHGRVHTNYNQNRTDDYGTNTGRLSSNGPNLQQVPKRNRDVAIPLRRAFIPDEGMRFVEADWSQMEPRLFAVYSKCKALIDGYTSNPPRDVHDVTSAMLEMPRNDAKRLSMGLFTGIGVNGLGGHLGVSDDEAREQYNSWFGIYPEIKQFQTLAKNVWTRRDIRTAYGRKARLDNPRFAYKATSRIIQGSGADAIKHALVECWEYSNATPGVDLLGSVHDSLVWQSDDPAKDAEMARIMSDMSVDPFNFNIPFPVDIGVGANWSEASFG